MIFLSVVYSASSDVMMTLSHASRLKIMYGSFIDSEKVASNEIKRKGKELSHSLLDSQIWKVKK